MISEPLDITIEKLVYGGHGLARVDGRVVLTPLVLPGERVSVEPTDKLHARLLHVAEPSIERIEPPCPYFAICGGCHYQHAPYSYQLEQKREILRETIRRVGKFDPPEEIRIISGPEWNYRNRTQLHVAGGRIGYLKMGSHDLCPIDHCPISSPLLNECIGALARLAAERRFPGFVRRIELFTNETDVQVNVLDTAKPLARHFFDWLSGEIPGYARGALSYEVVDFQFRVGPRSFFQVNRFLVGGLMATALANAEGDSALDLYAGVGLFSIPLAQRFKEVTAVESGSSAAADLQHNAERAGVAVRVMRANTDEYLKELESAPDFVLADPPREGLGKAAVTELVRLRPKRLHIVACDPATMARDLASLLRGGYRIEAMTLIDLFPQTYHLETVVSCVL